MAKSSYRGDSLGQMTCQRPSLRAKISTKIWTNGFNPNYNTTRPNSGLNLRNCCWNVRARDSLLSFATPYWFCGSHQRELPLWVSSLNYSRFYLIDNSPVIIYYNSPVIILFFYTKFKLVELHFVRAWDCCQQDAVALADQHGDCKVCANY